jgi:hypothetical protein
MNLNVKDSSYINPENHMVTLTNVGFDNDGMYVYQIKKKAKFKVTIPGRDAPIYCHNATGVSIALKEHGRNYSVTNVYNLFWRRKGSDEDVYKRHRSKKKLNGATIEKLVYAPPSTSPSVSIIPSI